MHILSECLKLAQTEHKKRLIRSPLWFTGNHVASMVLNLTNTGMNQDTKIMWDFNIKTDRVIESRCPDIVWSLMIKRTRKRSSLMWLYSKSFVSGTKKGWKDIKMPDNKDQETFIIDVAIIRRVSCHGQRRGGKDIKMLRSSCIGNISSVKYKKLKWFL